MILLSPENTTFENGSYEIAHNLQNQQIPMFLGGTFNSKHYISHLHSHPKVVYTPLSSPLTFDQHLHLFLNDVGRMNQIQTL